MHLGVWLIIAWIALSFTLWSFVGWRNGNRDRRNHPINWEQ